MSSIQNRSKSQKGKQAIVVSGQIAQGSNDFQNQIDLNSGWTNYQVWPGRFSKSEMKTIG